jgi:methyltransferase-like protein 6
VGPEYLLLDAGCGVGNGFYPLFREYHPRLKVNACDFSPRAVEFAKQHPIYNPKMIDLKVCDLVNDPALPFTEGLANFGIMLFVLSAISPENFHSVAKKIYDQLADNGILYFRDYGRYDLAQLRLA